MYSFFVPLALLGAGARLALAASYVNTYKDWSLHPYKCFT